MSETIKPTIAIYDMATDTTTEREMTEAEFAQHKIDQVEWSKLKSDAEAKAAQRRAILEHLGITEEEARILLGGN